MEDEMRKRAEYQVRILPSDVGSYITSDSDPELRCEKNIIYKIPESIFPGIHTEFRVRKRAKEFAQMCMGKVFAVIYMDDRNKECLYFGNLILSKQHTDPILYLTRCVGSTVSKRHWSKVRDYIFLHYKEIYNLETDNVLKYIV